jgi:hypothetical protein
MANRMHHDSAEGRRLTAMIVSRTLLLALVGALAAGCDAASSPASPGARDARSEANVIAQSRCTGVLDDKTIASALSDILDGTRVEGVEPIYGGMDASSKSLGTRLAGAAIYVPPIPGMTPPLLDRALECHAAQRILAGAPASSELRDPFALLSPDVQIGVRAAQDSFRIDVESTSVAVAHEILERAQALRSPPPLALDK